MVPGNTDTFWHSSGRDSSATTIRYCRRNSTHLSTHKHGILAIPVNHCQHQSTYMSITVKDCVRCLSSVLSAINSVSLLFLLSNCIIVNQFDYSFIKMVVGSVIPFTALGPTYVAAFQEPILAAPVWERPASWECKKASSVIEDACSFYPNILLTLLWPVGQARLKEGHLRLMVLCMNRQNS